MCNRFITSAFSPSMIRQACSWRWVHCDFNEDFEKLQAGDALREDGSSEKIWGTSQKFVLKVVAPSGRIVVFKSYRKVSDWLRCIFRPSPLAREALNYQCLADMGLPMAKLLASGDTRSCFILKTGFLITEYAPCTGDGRDFYGSGKNAANHNLRDRFIHSVFADLAKLHNHGWIHRGSTPANFLYRLIDNTLQLIWIDVATCRKKGQFELKRLIPDDFVNFFRFFDFTPEQRQRFEEDYLTHATHNLFSKKELFASVEKRLRRNRKYLRRLERSRDIQSQPSKSGKA